VSYSSFSSSPTSVYTCTATGVDVNGEDIMWMGMRGKFRFGKLVCQVGNAEPQAPGVIEGKGALWLMAFTNGRNSDRSTGTIRVKIMKVADDE
jgi:hypothetical protein